MSADQQGCVVVRGLRARCNCNRETSSCGAEDECKLDAMAVDEIERLQLKNAQLWAALEGLYDRCNRDFWWHSGPQMIAAASLLKRDGYPEENDD